MDKDQGAADSKDEGTDETVEKEIILFADPMCSWCWGFSPVIAAIDAKYGERARISVVMGGLRPGTTEAMDEAAKATVRHHWEEVNRMTGQPFSFAFFERHGFVYDTEPPCRAQVTVRKLKPESSLRYLDALHRAFYVEGKDVTDTDILAGIAETVGVERQAFLEAFDSDDIRDQTKGDFRQSRRLQISGFPTVLLRDGRGLAALTVGYRDLETLAPHLETWLKG